MADDPQDTPPTEDVSGLKKALADERELRKAAEKDSKAAKKQLEDVQSRLEKLETDGKSETEKLIEAARNEGAEAARKEEREKTNARLLKSEVRLAAAGKLTDPEDAVRFLDLSEFEVKDDGTIDTEAISKAIGTLVESKPYLVSKGRPRGDIDAGARGGAPAVDEIEQFGKDVAEQLGVSS